MKIMDLMILASLLLALTAFLVPALCAWRKKADNVFANIAEGTHADAITKLTDAAITTRNLLYKVGTDASHIAVAGAGDVPLGTIDDEATAAEEYVSVKILGKGPTKLMVASEAMTTAGVDVFAAASGKIALTGTVKVGTLVGTAAADGDEVEVADCLPQFSLSKGATGAGGIGYRTGAGGTVTQATSKSTGVTLSKLAGAITLHNAALAADAIVSFVLTNTQIAAGDVLVLNHISGGTPGCYHLNARSAAGSATIDVTNISAGSLSEAAVIQFAVIKGVSA